MTIEPSALDVIRAHQSVAPVPVHDIARELGIEIYSGKWTNGASGCIRRDRKRGGKSGFAILTNDQHGWERRRFTIAHELGHYVLHRDKIGEGIVDDRMYRSRLAGPMEKQANEFAAWLLMPWDLVVREVQCGAGSVEELASVFQVSKSTMAIRVQVPYETD